MSFKLLISASVASLAFGSSAYAESVATSWTDLNLRAGPSPAYAVVGVIPADAPVAVEGCLEQSSWCKVTYDGTDGWASGNYLTTRAVLVPTEKPMVMRTVTYEKNEEADALAGAAAGAMAGALIAGPLGAAVGGVLGMGAGVGVGALDDRVFTYVQANPVEQVYLDGEVVVGAGLPDGVTLVPVPDSEYSYVYVNGVPVVVEPKDRRIVYIVR